MMTDEIFHCGSKEAMILRAPSSRLLVLASKAQRRHLCWRSKSIPSSIRLWEEEVRQQISE